MDVIREALARADAGQPFALGTVVSAQGSTPQKVGSSAVVGIDGRYAGTLGGGLVEAQALERLKELAEADAIELFEIRLDAPYSRDAGPICGGAMRMALNGRALASAGALRAAQCALDGGDRGVLVTALPAAGAEAGRIWWIAEGALHGSDVPVAHTILAEALRTDEPALVGPGEGEYFVAPIAGAPRLLVVGGGHVGQAIVKLAVYLGFRTTVADDRPEFTDAALFPPGVECVPGPPRDTVAGFPKGPNSYIILVSKGHKPDAEALEGCIHDSVAYLGMIGSKRKVRFLRKHFIESGLATEEEFARVHTPIGYEIGAVTVPEIGVSIAAQLIAARRRPESLFAAPGMQLTAAQSALLDSADAEPSAAAP